MDPKPNSFDDCLKLAKSGESVVKRKFTWKDGIWPGGAAIGILVLIATIIFGFGQGGSKSIPPPQIHDGTNGDNNEGNKGKGGKTTDRGAKSKSQKSKYEESDTESDYSESDDEYERNERKQRRDQNRGRDNRNRGRESRSVSPRRSSRSRRNDNDGGF